MKKIVFQINIPNFSQKNPEFLPYSYNQDMYEISNRNAMRYALKCGAAYYLLADKNDFVPAIGKHLDYQKLKFYDFSDYDAVLYLDSDYIIKDNAPDLFEICGDNFSICLDQGSSVIDRANELQMTHDRYFNAGMMYIPKTVIECTKQTALDYLQNEYVLQGQGLLNKLFYDCGIIPNVLNYMDWNPVKRTFGTYADHYSGNKKDRWGTVSY